MRTLATIMCLILFASTGFASPDIDITPMSGNFRETLIFNTSTDLPLIVNNLYGDSPLTFHFEATEATPAWLTFDTDPYYVQPGYQNSIEVPLIFNMDSQYILTPQIGWPDYYSFEFTVYSDAPGETEFTYYGSITLSHQVETEFPTGIFYPLFGDSPLMVDFSYLNQGDAFGDGVDFSLSDDQTWCTLDPTSGFIQPGYSSDITATIDYSGFGEHLYAVNVTWSTYSFNLPAIEKTIYILPQNPVDYMLSENEFFLTLPNNPTATTTLSLSNIADHSIPYDLTKDGNWITAGSHNSVLAAYGTEDIDFSINATGMSSGTYTGSISWVATGYPTITKYLTLHVTAPTHSITPTSFHVTGEYHGDDPIYRTLTITNSNSQNTLTFNFQNCPMAWLSITPNSGSVSPNSSTSIQFSFNNTHMDEGQVVSANVELHNNDGSWTPDIIPVTFEILGNDQTPPTLLIEPSSYTITQYAYNDTRATDEFVIYNLGGSHLVYSVSDNRSWIEMPHPVGRLSHLQHADFVARFSSATLNTGTYTGSIVVSHNDPEEDSPRIIPVEMDVTWRGCDYVPGDINGSGSTNGLDVSYGQAYFRGGNPPPDICYDDSTNSNFYAAGDCNGNCQFNGVDLTYLVGYLQGQHPSILHCHRTPPVSRILKTEPEAINQE
jgi:hypothetical protein